MLHIDLDFKCFKTKYLSSILITGITDRVYDWLDLNNAPTKENANTNIITYISTITKTTI